MKVEPKRRALGKGLSSLIPDGPAAEALVESAPADSVGGARELPIDRIRPNPRQPRKRFDEEEIADLAASIKQSGVLQPLIVREEKDGLFTLVAGERRWRAARKAGLERVPVTVRRLTDDQMLAIALIENLQRDDLAPLETARGFRTLIREFGLTQAEVAERVGKPRSSIANFLRLLELPDEVQELLDSRTLEMGHGRALAGLADREQSIRLARQAASSKWSVREIEERVRRANTLGPAAPHEGAARDPNVAAAEQTLSRALAAKVAIQTSRAGRGRIEIRFAGDEDLDRLYRLLLRASGSQVH